MRIRRKMNIFVNENTGRNLGSSRIIIIFMSVHSVCFEIGGVKGCSMLFENVVFCIAILRRGLEINILQVLLW